VKIVTCLECLAKVYSAIAGNVTVRTVAVCDKFAL